MPKPHLMHAPGPRRWSPFGSLPELRRDPLGTLVEARSTYGDVVKFRSAIWFAYLLSHPEDVKHVLQDNHQNYTKGFVFEYLKPVLGRGLLTNDGESWRRQRRLVQPAFQHQRLGELAAVMTSALERMLNRWREQTETRPVDLTQAMTGLTLEIVTRALLGSGFGSNADAVSEAVRVAQEHINWQITHLLSLSDHFPTHRNRQFKRALGVLNNVVYSIIDVRRTAIETWGVRPSKTSAAGHRESPLVVQADETSNDLLTLLLAARDPETGEGMTEIELRDEVMTIFLAGHETTTNALVWAWHLLALNPEVEERLHAEVDRVLDGRPPALADLGQLRYTRMVFDEALRVRPPVWAIFRCPLADDTAGRYRVPAFASVILSPYVTHRHPEFWDEPCRFDPERFRPELVAERPKYAYFPFGGGPRMCIGSEFAAMEGVLALASIAREFRLRPVPGHVVALEPLITLRPLGGLPMLVERRDHRVTPAPSPAP